MSNRPTTGEVVSKHFKLFTPLLLAVVAILVNVASASAAGQSLINGGFEQRLEGWSFDSFQQDYTGYTDSFFGVGTRPFVASGNYSGYLATGSLFDDIKLRQAVSETSNGEPIMRNHKYTLSGNIRPLNVRQEPAQNAAQAADNWCASLAVEPLDLTVNDLQDDFQHTSPLCESRGSLVPVQTTICSHDATSFYVEARLGGFGRLAAGNAYYDNIRLVSAPGGC